MTLNKQIGNMYGWVTHTYNIIKGRCPHNCDYCYVKRFPIGDLRFDEKCLNDDLGTGKTIFVGSSCDMWADKIPVDWIASALSICANFDNTYLFQTKNPWRFVDFWFRFPKKTILGATIESNRRYNLSEAPQVAERAEAMASLSKTKEFKIMISVEPVLDFDVKKFSTMLRNIHPDFISIGADSKKNNLPEPSKEKVEQLISKLKEYGFDVKLKNNLKRIIGAEE